MTFSQMHPPALQRRLNHDLLPPSSQRTALLDHKRAFLGRCVVASLPLLLLVWKGKTMNEIIDRIVGCNYCIDVVAATELALITVLAVYWMVKLRSRP